MYRNKFVVELINNNINYNCIKNGECILDSSSKLSLT